MVAKITSNQVEALQGWWDIYVRSENDFVDPAKK